MVECGIRWNWKLDGGSMTYGASGGGGGGIH